MEGDKNAKKGISEKRAVRKPKKTNPRSAPEADLKAAAEGTDLAKSAPAETPKATRRKATRSAGTGAAAKNTGSAGESIATKPKTTRRQARVASTTPGPSPSAASTAAPKPPIVTLVQGQLPVTESTAEIGSSAVESQPLAEPAFEQIQLRAYFIAERRRAEGIDGDEQSDWRQAREELIKELKGH